MVQFRVDKRLIPVLAHTERVCSK